MSAATLQRGLHARPFRFGVFGEGARSRTALLNTARRAEDSGYAKFLIRDHFIEEPFGHQLAPWAALVTVAAVTDRLRVGSLVLANDYRHPVILAKEAATLDVLSNGRFERSERVEESRAFYVGLLGRPSTMSMKKLAGTPLQLYASSPADVPAVARAVGPDGATPSPSCRAAPETPSAPARGPS